ncbi:hypothetical protein U1Q18_014642 [Sarracenia purpurea var. burkii]
MSRKRGRGGRKGGGAHHSPPSLVAAARHQSHRRWRDTNQRGRRRKGEEEVRLVSATVCSGELPRRRGRSPSTDDLSKEPKSPTLVEGNSKLVWVKKRSTPLYSRSELLGDEEVGTPLDGVGEDSEEEGKGKDEVPPVASNGLGVSAPFREFTIQVEGSDLCPSIQAPDLGDMAQAKAITDDEAEAKDGIAILGDPPSRLPLKEVVSGVDGGRPGNDVEMESDVNANGVSFEAEYEVSGVGILESNLASNLSCLPPVAMDVVDCWKEASWVGDSVKQVGEKLGQVALAPKVFVKMPKLNPKTAFAASRSDAYIPKEPNPLAVVLATNLGEVGEGHIGNVESKSVTSEEICGVGFALENQPV